MKVALVYDRANKWGGAERLLLALHEMYPKAPLYTAVYNPQGAPWAKVFPKVIPSFLQKFPFAKSHHEAYFWLMPLAFESFDFSEYDLVISVTSESAKGIITQPKTLHICYCLTPTRYLWQSYEDYFKNPWWRALSLPIISKLRIWDQVASQRPDYYSAISQNVCNRIKKYYQRDSEVIYPPVNFDVKAEHSLFQPAPRVSRARDYGHSTLFGSQSGGRGALEKGDAHLLNNSQSDYFLVVSRLVPYKRIDIAIEAFNQLGTHLVIIGSGSEEKKLKKMARSNVQFLGQNLTDKELLPYYQDCRAIVCPGEEDFGLVPVEAQLCGKPVIAYKVGGVLETVIPGVTGEFFYPQTAEALIETVKHFKDKEYKSEDCQKNAEKFGCQVFKKRFLEFVNSKLV